jgi:hypothetical protein
MQSTDLYSAHAEGKFAYALSSTMLTNQLDSESPLSRRVDFFSTQIQLSISLESRIRLNVAKRWIQLEILYSKDSELLETAEE